MIITHTLKKHRIKNYQIFIFCINLYRKILKGKPKVFHKILQKRITV
ncbi:hypothetical protein J616_01919 [Acinetobacter baumannii 1457504]|nr:hypothetical protein J616_01919 [Acinetobacter baumannii 1457504]